MRISLNKTIQIAYVHNSKSKSLISIPFLKLDWLDLSKSQFKIKDPIHKYPPSLLLTFLQNAYLFFQALPVPLQNGQIPFKGLATIP
jgi:hypothetical protein